MNFLKKNWVKRSVSLLLVLAMIIGTMQFTIWGDSESVAQNQRLAQLEEERTGLLTDLDVLNEAIENWQGYSYEIAALQSRMNDLRAEREDLLNQLSELAQSDADLGHETTSSAAIEFTQPEYNPEIARIEKAIAYLEVEFDYLMAEYTHLVVANQEIDKLITARENIIARLAAIDEELSSMVVIDIMPLNDGDVTVTFDPNGGETLSGHASRPAFLGYPLGGDMPMNPTAPQGAAFIEWNTEDDGSGDIFDEDTIVEGDLTVYAIWGYELTFMGNPLMGDANITILVPRGSSVNAALTNVTWPNNPEMIGHGWVGWYDEIQPIDGTGGNRFTADTPITTSAVLHTRWTSAHRIVTLNFNYSPGNLPGNQTPVRSFIVLDDGTVLTMAQSTAAPFFRNRVIPGSGGSPTVEHTYLTPSMQLGAGPQPRGMSLEGWYTQPNGQGTRVFGTTLPAGHSQNIDTAVAYPMLSAVAGSGFTDITLYAHMVYVVEFNENPNIAGVTPPAGIMHRFISVINSGGNVLDNEVFGNHTLPPDPQPRDGMTFMGWYTTPIIDTAADPHIGGIPYTLDFAITQSHAINAVMGRGNAIFARWRLTDYVTITFDADGGAFGGGAPTQTRTLSPGAHLVRETASPPPSIPTRPGYTFTGFFTEPNGGGDMWIWNTRHYEDQTLYARWTQNITINIWHNLNSPNHPGGSPDQVRQTVSGFSMAQVRQIGMRTVGIQTAVGQTFDRANIGLPLDARPGFRFINSNPVIGNMGRPNSIPTGVSGWWINQVMFNTQPDGRGMVFGIDTQITSDMDGLDLFVMWTADVTFNNNQSSVSPLADTLSGIRQVVVGTNFSEDLVEQHVIVLQNRENDGTWILQPNFMFDHLVFAGWNTQADGNGVWFTENSYVHEEMTVYAIWIPGIVFNSGFAPYYVIPQGDRVREGLIPGQAIPNFPINPVWPGQTFLHWSVNADGTGIQYSAGMNFTQARILYAQWSGRVDFSAGPHGTIVGDPYAVIDIGSPIGGAMAGTSATRPNWHFNGFATAQGNAFTPTSIVEASQTVIAQWQGRISFDLDGGHVAGQPAETTVAARYVNENAAFGGLPTVQKEGYSFLRWETTGGVTVTAATIMNMGDVTLIAVYAEYVDVTFVASPTTGGTLSFTSIRRPEGHIIVAADIPSATPNTNDGYTSSGWATNPLGATVAAGGSSFTYNFTRGTEVTVTFTASPTTGGTLSTTSIQRPVGWVLREADIPTATPNTNDGYTSSGWATAPLGATVAAGGSSFTYNFTRGTEVEVTFTANPTTGGTLSSTSIQRPIGWVLREADIPTPTANVDDGYSLGSWATNPIGVAVAATNNSFVYNFNRGDMENIVFNITPTTGGYLSNATLSEQSTITILRPVGWLLRVGDIPTVTVNTDDGYTSDGWNSNPVGVRVVAGGHQFTYEVELGAEVAVTFARTPATGGELSFASIQRPIGWVLRATDIPTPTANEDDGYTLGDWDNEPLGATVAATGNDFIFEFILGNMVDVTFNVSPASTGTLSFATIQRPIGWLLRAVDIPTHTATAGYVFESWVNAAAPTVQLDMADLTSHAVEGGETFTAVFVERNYYTVTFEATNGTVYSNPNAVTLQVRGGRTVTSANMPEITANSGYEFSHWVSSNDLDEELTLTQVANYVINGDVTFTAVFTAIPQFQVSFNLHGGAGSFPTQTILRDQTATAPTNIPTRTGFTFTGWFTSATGGTAFNFGTPITANTVVHARWQGAGGNGGPSYNLVISKAANMPHGGQVIAGETITYSINVRNSGNASSGTVTIRDIIATGMTLVPNSAVTRINGAVNAAITPNISGNTISWTISSIAPGEIVEVSFDVTVNPLPTGIYDRTLRNTAQVNGRNTNTIDLFIRGLIKHPDRMQAYVGETINWTLRGFHNPMDSAVTNFAIIDMPNQGLNFRSGSIPAFANGAGITYDIRYRVAGSNVWHTHATGVNANAPFSFALPQPGNLHYTDIGLFFGTVPVGFGRGNQIVFTFVIGNNAPNNTLINDFLIMFDNVERPGASPDRPTVNEPGAGGGAGTPGRPTPTIPFSPTHHAYMVGDNNGMIRPNASITRAEVATIFFRLVTDDYRTQMWTQQNRFPDVQIDNWFNNAVSTMTNAAIFTGMPDGTFQPQRAITRAEFAVAMTRFFTGLPMEGANMFLDVAGHWAAREINAAARMGWVTGFPNGNFAPDQAITRAEAAALVNRILLRLPRTTADLLPGMVVWPDNANVNSWFYLYIQEASNSNEFVMQADGIHKTWTELLRPRAWEVLERPNSRPQDIIGQYR